MRETTKLFTLLVLLTAVFLTACPPLPFPKEEDPFDTGVEYAEDWRFVTIYLDYNDDISINLNKTSASRAMNPDTARIGFEYFEVCFFNNGNVVRTDWEIGYPAYANKVPRNFDYGATHTANGVGAILFAGRGRKYRKEDDDPNNTPLSRDNEKTLLGVGKIHSVDGVPGTYISASSTSVTFEVFALTATVDYDINKSSFKATNTNINIIKAIFDNKLELTKPQLDDKGEPMFDDEGNPLQHYYYPQKWIFPLYILPSATTQSIVKAEYKYNLTGYADQHFVNIDGTDLLRGIIISDDGIAETREARFPAGNGKYWYPIYNRDKSTEVTMTNNKKGSIPQNPIQFDIDISKTDNFNKSVNGLFILCFKIPVCALVIDNRLPDFRWHIKPAYQSYYYNIDNGKDSKGGGVLMGVDLQKTDLEVGAKRDIEGNNQ